MNPFGQARAQGIDVELQDVRGKSIQVISDLEGFLADALPSWEDEAFHYLRLVDPYGETTFCFESCAGVADELRRLADGASGEARTHLGNVERLAREAARQNLCLAFIGD